MFFELVAAVAAAFLAGGLALILTRLSGGRLPKWLVPVAAGAAMIGYAVWSEYTWYGRTAAQMPDGLEVTLVNEARAAYRPWTYLAPYVDRFAAVDARSVRTNETVPDARIADMYFFERWGPVRKVEVVFDCSEGRSAPLVTVSFGPGGAIADAAWSAAEDGDRSLAAACRNA